MSLNHPGHAIAHSSDKTGAKDKNARFPTSDQPRPAEDPVPKAGGTAGMDHVTAVEPKRNARKCQSMINLQRTFDLNHLSRGTPRPDQRGWSIAVVLRACGGRAMLNRGHIKCRKADDQQCHPTPKSEPHSTYISINSTNAPSDNEPPSFVSISGVSSRLWSAVCGRARNLASATPYHRTLRLVLAMRLPLATAVKSIWYTG